MEQERIRESFREYYRKNKGNSRCFMFKFNRESDSDVIERIESKRNKTDYIRRLVRSEHDDGE